MSFDTTFDYTSGKANSTTILADLDSQLSTLQNEMSAMETSGADQSTIYQKYKDCIYVEAMKSGINALLSEITNVENLSVGDKEILYKFWLAYANSSTRYMAEICYNHTQMLADTDFVDLANDTVLSAPDKKTQAEAIMLNYPLCYYNYEDLLP